MQALAIALLLAVSAAAETAEDRPDRAIAGLEARRLAVQPPQAPDPCAAAREIARQPPCLAGGDCRALELWRQSFGSPRIEPLEPGRAAARFRAGSRGGWRDSPPGGRQLRGDPGRRPPTSPPGPRRPLTPGFVCPAGADPLR